jgi:hypothetical protein
MRASSLPKISAVADGREGPAAVAGPETPMADLAARGLGLDAARARTARRN